MIIDGQEYDEKSASDIPFGNVCLKCAFYDSSCYDRTDFSCHGDERPDGLDVVFILANQKVDLTGGRFGVKKGLDGNKK